MAERFEIPGQARNEEGEAGMATTGPSTGSGTGRREIPGQARNEEERPGNDAKEIPGQARHEAERPGMRRGDSGSSPE